MIIALPISGRLPALWRVRRGRVGGSGEGGGEDAVKIKDLKVQTVAIILPCAHKKEGVVGGGCWGDGRWGGLSGC